MNPFTRPLTYLSLATFLSSPLLSSNTASADQHPPQKKEQKKDQPLELLGRLQGSHVCGDTVGYRTSALVDLLSLEIANKVVSKYQGGNIVFCEDKNNSVPNTRIFSEGKMYHVYASNNETRRSLLIKVCPYSKYQGCTTECRDGQYRIFQDENLDGNCDLINIVRGGRQKDSFYQPPDDKDARTKRRAQKAYEKVLRKVAKCYGIEE